jgi:hypothetical protein
MSKEQIKSSRYVATDAERREALARASAILRGLGSEITVRLLAARAARLVPGAREGVMRDFMTKKLTNDERAALGVRNRSAQR